MRATEISSTMSRTARLVVAVIVALEQLLRRYGYAVVFAITLLACLPLLRAVFWLGDEGIWLHGASRILQGDRIYADFFALHPPLAYLVPSAWMALFGESLLSVRILATLVISAIAAGTYKACLASSGNPLLSATVVLGFVAIPQGEWTQISHHWFTTLLSITVLNLSLSSDGQRHDLLKGVAVGAAGMITSTRGALLAVASIVCLIGPQTRSRLLRLVLGMAVTVTFCIVYLAATGTVSEAWDGVIVFAATRYSDVQSTAFGFGAYRESLLLVAVFPVALFLTTFTIIVSARRVSADPRFRVVLAFAVAGFLGCYPRPDIVHIGFNVPLALPLICYCLRPILGNATRARVLCVALALFSLPLAVTYLRLARSTLSVETVPTTVGPIAFPAARGEAALIRALDSIPRDKVFTFYPYLPMLPYILQRPHAPFVDVFMPNYSTAEQYYEACIATMQQSDYVVTDDFFLSATSLKQVFPKVMNPLPPERRALEQALYSGFANIGTFGGYRVYRRTAAANERLCDESEALAGGGR